MLFLLFVHRLLLYSARFNDDGPKKKRRNSSRGGAALVAEDVSTCPALRVPWLKRLPGSSQMDEILAATNKGVWATESAHRQ